MSISTIVKLGAGVLGAILLYLLIQQLRSHLKEYDRRGQAEAVETYKAAELDVQLKEETRLRKLAEEQRDSAKSIGDQNEAARTERTIVYRTIKEEIQNAPPEDDGPVAPVLRRTVERLSGPGEPTGPGNTDPNTNGSTGSGPTAP